MSAFDDLLNDWRTYVLNSNHARLGYKIPAYAERIGGGSGRYDDPEPRLDVMRLNDVIVSSAFPDALRDIILLHYLDPRSVKRKMTTSKDIYYATLGLAKRVLSDLYEASLPSTKVSGQPVPATVSRTPRP